MYKLIKYFQKQKILELSLNEKLTIVTIYLSKILLAHLEIDHFFLINGLYVNIVIKYKLNTFNHIHKGVI